MITLQQVTLKDVRSYPKVRIYIDAANRQMAAIGYTEHGHRHAGVVSSVTRTICESLGYSPRETELAAIAAYLHDIGNMVNRNNHPEIGAIIAMNILDEMGMDPREIAVVVAAIGNHEEGDGFPIDYASAAVIIADKSDVHYSRVQNPRPETFDIHDRVNHAVQRSNLYVEPDKRVIRLDLEIDTTFASVMEYFEIFLSRMVMCRKAAEQLECRFCLRVNGVDLG
ncbi:MAG: HD domain-containing protein [Armatimonadota bacterium]|nr:HD domain-containing protein [bacterium]MCS7310128.1 HD domain-containing protein [Armatimonadota bacterium]MDW8104008.1 HD domain-containing protein [Armatimonadota bacterium]MDW8290440.1 HD domain-containing protein [Armatimonadota bacterium]